MLRLAQFLCQLVNFFINGLLGFLQLIQGFSLRSASFLGVGLVQFLLSFLHLAFGLLQGILRFIGSLSVLRVLLGIARLVRQISLVLGLILRGGNFFRLIALRLIALRLIALRLIALRLAGVFFGLFLAGGFGGVQL